MIVDRLLAAAPQIAAASRDGDDSPIRLSNAGKCARRLAYQLHKVSGEPLSARSLMVFDLGHRVEAMLRDWCKAAGVVLEDEQREVMLRFVKEDGVTNFAPGHLDGTTLLDGERCIVDFKSISTDGYAELISGEGIDHSYLCTQYAYQEAAGIGLTIMPYLNKNTCHVCEARLYADYYETWEPNGDGSQMTMRLSVAVNKQALVEEVRQRFLRVLRSTPEALPEREHALEDERTFVRGKAPAGTPSDDVRRSGWYRRTGRKVLPWQCAYCAWHGPCWGVGEPEFTSGGKPVWVVEQPLEQTLRESLQRDADESAFISKEKE